MDAIRYRRETEVAAIRRYVEELNEAIEHAKEHHGVIISLHLKHDRSLTVMSARYIEVL